MGRLVGIPHFLSENAYEEEKRDVANVRRAKKEQAEDFDPLQDDYENDSVKGQQILAATRMQSQFENRILRRTIDSKDWQGKLLLNLPPCKSIYAVLTLTEREMSIILELGEAAKERYAANLYLISILVY
jgi:hypothetical protein